MFEVEAKLALQDVAGMKERLHAVGATPDARVVEEDLFFQHPTRDFRETDEALRLRTVNGVQELTYKGPNQSATLKSRVEWNVPVGENPSEMLEALGFVPAATLRKEREFWQWGSASVTLDHLPFGDFIEVEVISENRASAEAQVEEKLNVLGLQNAPRIRDSYLALAERHGEG